MLGFLSGNATAIIIAVVTVSIPSFCGAWISLMTSKKIKTNHGKTIGQHTEQAGEDAQAAKVTAQLVALQLQEYKSEQRAASEAERKLIEKYVADDAAAHIEMRSLIIQVAQGRVPPQGG